ncbi:MAG: bacterial/archaeal transporter family-2 protein [Acidimicrobiaceae bacterium]
MVNQSNDGVDPDRASVGSRPARALSVAIAAGVLGGIQPKINADLGERVGSTVIASLVNFMAALAIVVVVLSLRPDIRRRVRHLRSWPVPRWTLTAGLGGAIVVLAGALAVERIGVAIFSVAFFAGQISFGLLVDRFGIGPGGVRHVIAARAVAALIAIAAVAVSQIGRPVGEFAPALVLFVVAAGAASAFQSAFNARIATAVGDAFAATAVNVAVGFTALSASVAVLAAAGRLPTLHWPTEPWLYVGGILGVTIVLSLAVASAALGVLRATLAMLASQLTTAFVVDWAVENDAPTPGVIAGAAFIVVAVVLVGRPGRGRQQSAEGPARLPS